MKFLQCSIPQSNRVMRKSKTLMTPFTLQNYIPTSADYCYTVYRSTECRFIILPIDVLPSTVFPITVLPSTVLPTDVLPSTDHPITVLPSTVLPSTDRPITILPPTVLPTDVLPITVLLTTIQSFFPHFSHPPYTQPMALYTSSMDACFRL